MIIVIFLIIRSSASSVKLLPDTQAYQVVSCFRTIFRPIWHVDYGGDQTLAHVFHDMHDVEAMRRADKLPVWKLPETYLVFHTFIIGLSCCLFCFFPGLGQS